MYQCNFNVLWGIFGRGEFSFQNGLNIWTDVKLANAAQYKQLYTAVTLVRKFWYDIYQLLNENTTISLDTI